MTLLYRAYWEVSAEGSRNTREFEKRDTNNEDYAKQLVTEHGAGYIEVLDNEQNMVVKVFLENGDWRVEHLTDNQSHMKIDIGEYE